MKKLIIVSSIVLASCGLMPTKFDNVQYYNLVKLQQIAETTRKECTNPDTFMRYAVALRNQSDVVEIYTKNTNSDDEVQTAVAAIGSMVDDVIIAYSKPQKPSAGYCSTKMDIIVKGVSSVVKTVGDKNV